MNDLEVRAAFARACSIFSNPAANSQANYGRYTQLDDLMDHIRPVLRDQGLAISQPIGEDVERDMPVVTTVVTSLETGVWFEIGRAAYVRQTDPMKNGAMVTYLRRFQCMAACGLAGDDDLEKGPKPAVSRSKPSNDQPSVPRPVGQISSAQLKALQTRYSTMERPERLALWAERIGRPVESANDLSKADAILLLTDDEGASHV
jgi:hypothetical protein